MDGWRIAGACLAPNLAGVAAPWAIWLCAGRIDCAEVAAVSFASALVYLRNIWTLGEREAAARDRLGRRYCGPGPMVALAVCSGLAGSLTMPGVSTFALVDAIGLPWAATVARIADPLPVEPAPPPDEAPAG